MKNNRMLMAEAIQKAFLGTTINQSNGLKDVIEHIGESRLIDVLLRNLLSIPLTKSTMISTLMSSIINAIANEVIYDMFVSNIREEELDSFDNLLERYNIFYNSRIKSKEHITRANMVPMIMQIDQKIISGSLFYGKLFSNKNKELYVKTTQKKVRLIRPLIHTIIELFNNEAQVFTYAKAYSAKFKSSNCIVGAKANGLSFHYMSKVPNTILDIKMSMPDNNVTLVTQSINTILNMPFTFDEDYNKMMMAIVDKPVFREILAGKSTDEKGINAKVTQAKADIKDGMELWENLGRGEVYFSYVVDFRGRISQIGGLSAVGHKAGKSMLRSGQSHELGEHGYDHILIALASAVGYDKETFSTRLTWAEENEFKYMKIGELLLEDPEEGFKELLNTDNPFDCAVLCLELYRINNFEGNFSEYCSNIFIGYDATCSAVQLVGLLMGNKKLTEASNVRVSETTEDKIYDSYALLSNIMDIAAPKIIDDENKESIEMWLSLNAKQKRAIAKPLLMTRLYGSKFLTHMDSCRDTAVDLGIIKESDRVVLRDFGKYIATLFNYAFDNEEGFNSLRSYEKFTKDISKAYNKKGVDTTWNIQDASSFEPQKVVSVYREFVGEQYNVYYDGKKHRERTYGLNILGNCRTELTYTEDKKLAPRKATSAIAPNFIHSHDAIVLHSTVTKLYKPMRLTHDCFATTPGMVQRMLECINKTYVELFGDNNLKQIEKLQEECFNNTGILVELPENYNRDGISSEEIEKAEYKFS